MPEGFLGTAIAIVSPVAALCVTSKLTPCLTFLQLSGT